MHVDLNLLVALDALLEENSVQGAADRLRLSAPAMSRTLGRIRRATGDDILVRSGRTMTPTPRALELREEAGELVRRAAALLTPSHDIDLAEVDRTFVVRCHDALLGALAPGLLDALAESMPSAAVRFVGETAEESVDLQRGRIDLDIGASPSPVPEISSKVLGADRLVAVMRSENALASAELTARTFASAQHVLVSRRGRTTDAVDDLLAEAGFERRVLAVVPTSTTALEVVAQSDAVCVVAGKMCARSMRRFGLVGLDLPFELPASPAIMLWHRRNDTDPSHRWLREQVAGVLGAALRS